MFFNLGADLGGKIVTAVVVECNVGTFSREHLTDGRTDATRSSTYKRSLSFKQKAHSLCVS
jgi:hypothetical protein